MRILKAAACAVCVAAGAACILMPLYFPERVRVLVAEAKTAAEALLR